ncbi:hypothetical protein DPMN_086997 [Dreissena polymorpha]|uniref:Uncharacterized protein n=1 Tax=Dreissena polymorpha TaxID=45954 RepID=A0A9D4KRZ9_DREPO|nr:hypothetical protein DPMN_086997 [Dreissena polymorpha]
MHLMHKVVCSNTILSHLQGARRDLCFQESQERLSQQTKATVLSRKVWELLMVLPTNPDVLVGFRSITHTQETVCRQ